jgi:hypothetical protein
VGKSILANALVLDIDLFVNMIPFDLAIPAKRLHVLASGTVLLLLQCRFQQLKEWELGL